jgi:DUF4097 and DUF4098 domain-containing protein YvlB
VHAEDTNRVSLDSPGRIKPGDKAGEFLVEPERSSGRVVLRCPENSNLIVGTSSGAVELHGRFGDVRVTTTSGSVHLENATRADLRLSSGKAQVDRCGMLRVQTASGDVRIGTCGDVEVAVANGRIEVGEANKVRAKTANGSVSVNVRGDAAIETISGKVRVGVAPGLHPSVRTRSLHGRTKNECPPGEDLQILVRTVNGDIEVVSA